MSNHIVLVNWTQEGIKNVKDSPSRLDAAKKAFQAVGAELQAITEDWVEEYNAIRPHEALGNVPPYQYAPKQI